MPRETAYPGVRASRCGKKVEIYFAVGARGDRRQFSWTLELPPTDSGRAEAYRIKEGRKARVRAGFDPLESPADNPPVSVVATSWQNHLISTDRAPRTVKSYTYDLNNHWLPFIASMPIREVRYAHLREIDETRDWQSPKTRKNSRTAIRSLFKYALQGDLIDVDPTAKFGTIKLPGKKIDTYSREERDLIMNWLRGLDDDGERNAPRKVQMYFEIAFGGGMRPGEIIALMWDKWDGHGFEVEVAISEGTLKETKTREQRYVPVLPELQKELLRFRSEQMARGQHVGHLFLTQYGDAYVDGGKFNAWFHTACEATGVRDLMSRHKPYPWRKTFETLAYDDEIDPYLIAEILGHSVETARKHYKGHRAKETLRKAAQKRT